MTDSVPPEAASPPDPVAKPATSGWAKLLGQIKRFRGPIAAVAGVGALFSGLVGYWTAYENIHKAVAPNTAPPAVTADAGPLSVTPPALSVGVMPLIAPPGDAAMAQKADAWTRDLTSILVLGGTIWVVPANAPQTKAEGDGGIGGVARTLNVRYVIEGQIRPSQDGTLLNLRLMNGATSEQIGSETVSLRETYTTQDQTRALRTGLRHLVGSLTSAEIRRVMAQPLGATTPMDYVIRAWALRSTEPTDTLQRAREEIKLYDEALRRDPNLVPALDGLASALLNEFYDETHIDRERAVRRIDEVTSREVNLAPTHASPWSQRAWALLYTGQWDASLEASARAIRIDPEHPGLIEERAGLMNNLGRPVEALALANQAMAIDPSNDAGYLFQACQAHMLLGQYELAIADCERANGLNAQNVWVDLNLAAAYAHRGETARAEIKKAEVLRLQPGRTIANLKNTDSLHPDYVRLSDETIYAGLRKAGFPEQ